MKAYTKKMPEAQGLYDPAYEHDACGIGFVVHIKGEASHAIVQQGLQILSNLAHRGGAGSEENTGDGAGILLQLPDRFFRKVLRDLTLPKPGHYGVGMVFMPRLPKARAAARLLIEKEIKTNGQKVLAWRDLPVNERILGSKANDARPHFAQVFIGRSEHALTDDAFERQLFVIRKRCEKATKAFFLRHHETFYFASLSSRTLVYKGMLTAQQMDAFYMDLADLDVTSALALVHSRYSTNTFPSWERAHPYRYLIHNGEINTLRGNINAMRARESHLQTDLFGCKIEDIGPILNEDGSDSAVFDNCLEFLTLCGRPIEHAAMMMVPEPWQNHESMSDELKAFYEFHSLLLEPWDGPAAMAFTDGRKVGAILDRNGLRPSRYTVTADNMVILSSETGVLDIAPQQIIEQNRLRPGRLLLIDTQKGQIIEDAKIKEGLSKEHPYRAWLKDYACFLSPVQGQANEMDTKLLRRLQLAFGYTHEDSRMTLLPMAKEGQDPLGAMGVDTPLAVLSQTPQLLYNYFKQLFAQVTNPPIDALREKIVVSSRIALGAEGNLLDPRPVDSQKLILEHPILDPKMMAAIQNIDVHGFKSETLSTLYPANSGEAGLKDALSQLFADADKALDKKANIIILSDVGITKEKQAMPALLATSALHQYMVRSQKRKKFSLVLASGEPREVHHFALLIGYGVSAIYPYLAYETIDERIRAGFLDIDRQEAMQNYARACVNGLIKVLSKMGISTIQSYKGAQIFEAVGIGKDVIDAYFTSTPSRIGGIGLAEIAAESEKRHAQAFAINNTSLDLPSGGSHQWRKDGETHLFNPQTVRLLQQAVRTGDYAMFRRYSDEMNQQSQQACTIRGLLCFVPSKEAISIEEVESVETIVRRFKTGAMSYGSISKEAHEALAIAMNRLGGKSNTGEGGEDADRYSVLPNGDSRNSAIKQVASGRFGVTSHYLINAKELQIKMAQGAKPGEGGQLPGNKVYPWIAKTRHSTPGVGLISPPPHHDIYSIEDLAQLIFDLKNANKYARISVKLVSEVGVGTVAAGVAKGHADVVLISGHDGGTGASPRTSIRHAGLPWELGLAETHQTLVLNDLRSRITVETDGKLLTGRDVAVAALLGAEEFGFATGPLVALGCVMMRVCNLDTCPVGVATQNPALRKKFRGRPEHVVNFMRFIAQELREIMAELGLRTIDEMVGRTDLLCPADTSAMWKANKLDVASLLHRPKISCSGTYCRQAQDHKLEETLDYRVLIPLCTPALSAGKPVTASLLIRNTDRAVGTQLGSEVTRRYGVDGLPKDTIHLSFTGTAGQSFGAFIPKGICLCLNGEANDYLGKGLSGGRIIVRSAPDAGFCASSNITVGNTLLYGATSGEAYLQGMAGERFCVRNSGATAVVEGCGDHGCEYMTGGCAVILGPIGRNFAAGMSGGIAYVLDTDKKLRTHCNMAMVRLSASFDEEEIIKLRAMIQQHVKWTNSAHAQKILDDFDRYKKQFVKVVPIDYEKMLKAIDEAKASGLEGDDAHLAAFENTFARKNADAKG